MLARNSGSDHKPRAADSSGLFISDSHELLGGELFLMLRIHQLAVGLVVPPHVAEIGVQHVRAGMHVAHDALAGGRGRRELVLDRMARLVLRDRGIGRNDSAPRLPNLANGPEWTGERSFAYTTWHAVQPLER